MKTKLFTGVAVVFLVLSNPLMAEEDHHKDGDSRQSSPGMMMSGGMPMMDMKTMHDHMAKMQKTMDQVLRSKNMKEQQELMHQHMKEMHEGMGMMQRMMSGSMPGPMGDKQMRGDMPKGMGGQMSDDQMRGKGRMEMMDDDDDMSDVKAMRKRHNVMEQRMDMMQGMMGQMMEHMMQQQKMGMGSK